MTTRHGLFVLCVLCGFSATASAQTAPKISLRPFVEVSEEQFTATETFNAVFGHANEPFYGGGLQVTFSDRFYGEVAASRFRKNGDRVFRDATGQVFHLGIPLTATLTPFEVTGGYRFHPRRRRRPIAWLVPYAGAGIGSYQYRETSQFAEAGEDLDTRHTGFVAHGGAEFRLHRWVGVAADLQYTHVPGIFGTGGISLGAAERDLGGIAGRFKIIVGR